MHLFLSGPGHLSNKAERIARDHGAALINHTDAQCLCGYGCRPYTCEASRRHWFEARNEGDSANLERSKELRAALEKAGIKAA